MSKVKRKISADRPDLLFYRIVAILEQARGRVVRAVNTSMVLAYRLIGLESRMIEEALHERRALTEGDQG